MWNASAGIVRPQSEQRKAGQRMLVHEHDQRRLVSIGSMNERPVPMGGFGTGNGGLVGGCGCTYDRLTQVAKGYLVALALVR